MSQSAPTSTHASDDTSFTGSEVESAPAVETNTDTGSSNERGRKQAWRAASPDTRQQTVRSGNVAHGPNARMFDHPMNLEDVLRQLSARKKSTAHQSNGPISPENSPNEREEKSGEETAEPDEGN